MENIFKSLEEKIVGYEKLLSDANIKIDNSAVEIVEKEINELKRKVEELNSSLEGKSKIERMKVSFNVFSIESEITLKEMELDEKKKMQTMNINLKLKSIMKILRLLKKL